MRGGFGVGTVLKGIGALGDVAKIGAQYLGEGRRHKGGCGESDNIGGGVVRGSGLVRGSAMLAGSELKKSARR